MSNWLVKSSFVGETTQYDKKILPDFRKPKNWLKSVSAQANFKCTMLGVERRALDTFYARIFYRARSGAGKWKISTLERNRG